MRLGLAAAALAVALAAGTARAGLDIHGRAILSYNQFEGDVLASRYFRQNYELRLDERPTDPLQFIGFFRVLSDHGTTLVDDRSRHFSNLLLQPHAELVLRANPWSIQLLYDLYAENTDAEGIATGRRRLTRLLGSLSWAPEEVTLPHVNLTAERRAATDALARIDNAASNLTAQVAHRRGELQVSATGIYGTYDDAITEFARRTTQLTGTAAYQGVLLDGRLSLQASYALTLLHMSERTSAGGAVNAAREVLPQRGIAAVDDTPLDDADHPLVPYPALTDRNFSVGAGISLGPTGQSFWNVGLDMGRYVSVDQILLQVRNAAGDPVAVGGPLTWSVYTSADGVAWAPVVTGIAATFVATPSAYQIDFPAQNTRYFKVVSFGVNAVETLVTEIQAFSHVLVAPGGRTTGSAQNNAVLAASYKVLDWMALTYNGLLNFGRQSMDPGPATFARDWDQAIGLDATPVRLLNVNLRLGLRHAAATGGFETRADIETATVQLRWLQDLRTTLQAMRTADVHSGQGGGTPSTVQAMYTFQNYALFYRTLDLNLVLGYVHQETLAGEFFGERLYSTLQSHALLTTWLDFYLIGLVQRASLAGLAGQAPGFASDRRISGEFWYHPSPQFMVNLRGGYAATQLYSGPTGYVRLQWYPAPGSDITLGAVYEQDVDESIGQRSRRVTVSPRWIINRWATLTLNWQHLTYSNQYLASRTTSFYATLYVNF